MTQCVFWIGSMMPEAQYSALCDLGYHNQQASRLAQKNIVAGLKKHYGCQFRFVSGPALPAYPRFKQFWPKTTRWESEDGDLGVLVGYPNIEYINREFKTRAMIKQGKALIKDLKKVENVTIYVNSPHTPFIKCGLAMKKQCPQAKLILVVPDLPQYMELNINPVKKLLKQLDYRRINKRVPFFDGYVLYSKHMAEAMGVAPEKTVVMEGCTTETEHISAERTAQPFTFMYSGKADRRFGMELMVEAFSRIENENCRLIITGTGDAEAFLTEAAQKDPRIQYYGFVEDYAKVKAMQAEADVLLNMRLPSEPASMYCFPSKLFEYMKTGNPVISFGIGGIPEEYRPYLLSVAREDAACLRETMEQAMGMDDAQRTALGMRAREFVLTQKNVTVQTKKIFDFVENP